MKKLGLFDGDIFAFQAASLSEYVHWWDDDIVTLMSDFNEAKRIAKSAIAKVKADLQLDKVIFVKSCATRKYWRHELMPEYKGHRKDRPPLVLSELKDWLFEEYESLEIANLEADDVMGIKATDPEYYPEYRKIIVSEDKDMQTLPAWLYNPKKDYQEWKQSTKDANRFHAMQSIAGDTTDGYSGAKGIGEDKAWAWLDEPYQYEESVRVLKSGPRKGEEETRWTKVQPVTRYHAWLSLFLKSGQTEEEAHKMWYVSRILRYTDYDYKTKQVDIPLPRKRKLNDS